MGRALKSSVNSSLVTAKKTNPRKRNLKPILASVFSVPLLSLGVTRIASAANQHWDINGVTAGATDDGGGNADGVWDDPNWSTDANGTIATAGWTSGNTAVFSAGTNAIGTANISVTSGQTVGGLTFQEGTVNLSGAALTLSTNATMSATSTGNVANNIGDGGSALAVTKVNGATLTLSGALSYGGATTVSGGTLALTGTNSLTGATIVNSGTLNLNYTTNNTNKLSTSAGITLNNNSNLNVIGSAAGATSQSVGTTTFGTSNSTVSNIAITTGLDQNATLNLGTVSRSLGSIVNFTFTNTGTGVASASTSSAGTGGILGGYATANNNTWVKYSVGTLSALADGEYDASNVSAASPSTTLATSINSLRFNDASGTIAAITGATTIATGGILVTAAAGPATISGSDNLFSGTSDFVFIHNGSSDLTVTAPLAGGAAVIKQGAGTLVLVAANTNTGIYDINAGKIKLGASNVIPDAAAVSGGSAATLDLDTFSDTIGTLSGASTVNINGGTLSITNDSTAGGAISILGGGVLSVGNSGISTISAPITIGAGGGTLDAKSTGAGKVNYTGTINTTAGNLALSGGGNASFTGIIGPGASTVTKTGTGTATLDATNTYSGGTAVNDGVLALANAAGAGTGNVTVASGASVNISTGISVANTLTINGTGFGGSGALRKSGASTSSWAGAITLGSASRIDGQSTTAAAFRIPATVNLNGFNLTTGGISNVTFAGSISGANPITKDGTNTVTFSANAYTGVTNITNGILNIQSATALGDAVAATTVSSGATLEVAGTTVSTEPVTLNGAGFNGIGALHKTGNTNTTFSGAITIGAGGITVGADGTASTNNLSVTSPLTISNTNVLTVRGTSSTTFTGAISLGTGGGRIDSNVANGVRAAFGTTTTIITSSTKNLTVGGTGAITIAGVISGAGRLVKDGTGTLTLTGLTNSFTGGATGLGVTINAGVVGHEGTSNQTGGTNTTFGKVPVSVVPDYVYINGGTLMGNRSGSGVASLANNMGVTLGANGGTWGEIADTVNVHIYSGTISGFSGGTFTYVGPGILSITDPELYDGPTNVTGGTLRCRASGGLGSGFLPNGTLLTISSGGTFDLDAYDETIGALAGDGNLTYNNSAASITIGGTSSAMGGATIIGQQSSVFSGLISDRTLVGSLAIPLTKIGTGTLTLTNSANLYSGTTSINGGVLEISAAQSIGTGALAFNGGTLRLLNPITTSKTITLNTSGGTIDTNGNNATLTGNVTSANRTFTKTGAGILTMSPASEWTTTGAITVNVGTLKYGLSTAGFGTSSQVTIASGAILDMNSFNDTFGSLTSAGTVSRGSNAAAFLDVGADGRTTTFSGPMIGLGTFTKSGTGTMTLSATTSTWTGGITVRGNGILAVTNDGALGNTNNGITLGDATTAGTFRTTAAAINNVNRNVTVAAGGGTLDTGGFSNTFGNLSVGGNLSVVAGGGVTSVNNFTVSAGSVNLNDNDMIVRTGSAGLVITAGGTYASGSIARLIKDQSLKSTLAIASNGLTALGVATAGDLGITTFDGQPVSSTDVLVKYTYGGDANLSGGVQNGVIAGASINIDDYALIDAEYNAEQSAVYSASWYHGDFDLNGKVNIDDYAIIDTNYINQGGVLAPGLLAGESVEALTGVSAVPEPASLSVLAMGGIALLARRRRNRN